MTIWRRVSCWIIKATRVQARARAFTPTHPQTHTHTQMCNTYCFSTATIASWKRLNFALHVHCLSCVTFIVRMRLIITVGGRVCCNIDQYFANFLPWRKPWYIRSYPQRTLANENGKENYKEMVVRSRTLLHYFQLTDKNSRDIWRYMYELLRCFTIVMYLFHYFFRNPRRCSVVLRTITNS
jgi:hypothetical protein